MTFDIRSWHRAEFNGIPIYLNKHQPDWFVPNRSGDKLLRWLDDQGSPNGDPDAVRFFQALPRELTDGYKGRADYLTLERLGELWFHVTNQCNLACAHCLFSSGPKDGAGLDAGTVAGIARQAHALGCRVFALTGGEPLIHGQIDPIITGLLDLEQSHVMVLTNGMNLPEFLSRNPVDPDRFHLQISVDGMAQRHEQLRGAGTFQRLARNLDWLGKKGMAFTLSMCVTAGNVTQMTDLVEFAANAGAGNVHFMWFFKRGRGENSDVADVDLIFENLARAAEKAAEKNIRIDNIESLKTQIFAPRGTIHDGTTAGWESLAVGPDGLLYPSAAMIGLPELAMNSGESLERVWRHNPVLENIRSATAAGLASPLRFLLGGGDSDHSYIHNGTFIGDDPYLPLYEKMALWLMTREAGRQPAGGPAGMRLRMGEILESCGAHGKVALVHSNCLLATAGQDSLTTVKSFYAEAAGDKKNEILNPVCYDDAVINHIPRAYRFRGYGCGSPVLDADIQEGERIVDLGCGSGVECFVAARLAGEKGRVTGVDMLDPMLALAGTAGREVARNLGYQNFEFRKGYLEALPMDSETADVVISNCVMNLSVNKRRAYAEIMRVLAPGGRLVISDVVCETDPDPAIRNDETLRGECIAGAMTQSHLMALLEETGFKGIHLIKRFAYRKVRGHDFYSLTYRAVKPKPTENVRVIYRGPLPCLVTAGGTWLPVGAVRTIPRHDAELLADQVFILDDAGQVTNVAAENTCACFVSPEARGPQTPRRENILFPMAPARQAAGCMVCGAPLAYHPENRDARCYYCGQTHPSAGLCRNGHFVCDACHAEDGLKVIRHICMKTDETDMIRLMDQIRRHPAIPVHGPEHHALVPGVILATYRNLGGRVAAETLESGIQRGSQVAGGYCAFMGVCGAAVGVGVAFSLILGANPLTPRERKASQKVVHAVLGEIAKFKAARCCQRDSWIALKKASELSKTYLQFTLKADGQLPCDQKEKNKECLGKGCPLYR